MSNLSNKDSLVAEAYLTSKNLYEQKLLNIRDLVFFIFTSRPHFVQYVYK
jgi:hypothetical protein